MADLNDIKQAAAQDEEIVDLEMHDRDGNPYLAPDGTPATFGIRGRESKAVKQARDAVQRRLLRDRRTTLTPEDVRKNRVQIASAAVVRWHGWTAGGNDLPFTPENLAALLQIDHLLDQVEEGVGGHSSFFAKS